MKSPEAVVITGMRRVGKTTLMKYIYDRIDSKNKIWLDLENPAKTKLFDEPDYDQILENLRVAGLDGKGRQYVFLDEIQLVKNLPSVVKYLIDHYAIKFVMSGSASYYLKNHFSESLAGRKFIFELYPLDWSEFLLLKQAKIKPVKVKEKVSESMFYLYDRYYAEFLSHGGFPGVVLKSSLVEKNQALDEIFSSYYQLEVGRLSDFQKLPVMRDLILLLAARIGQKLEVQKLSQELKVSRETIVNYLSFLESTYLISLVRPYSRNKDVEIRKTAKIYFCDAGLARRLGATDEGAIFENMIFNSLKLKGEVNYYQKKTGVEIDFILDKNTAYEVKLKPFAPDGARLKKVCKELGLKKWWLVSRHYTELSKTVYGFAL